MKKKLFVGGLSWDTDDTGLRNAFSEHGDVVDAVVITERYTGRSRGFGFVTFATPDGAATAIDEMNGKDLDGRTIAVEPAKDKSSGRRDSGGGSYNRGSSYDRW